MGKPPKLSGETSGRLEAQPVAGPYSSHPDAGPSEQTKTSFELQAITTTVLVKSKNPPKNSHFYLKQTWPAWTEEAPGRTSVRIECEVN